MGRLLVYVLCKNGQFIVKVYCIFAMVLFDYTHSSHYTMEQVIEIIAIG